jgi:transcriptional regulator with XRE-family HTH domain
MSQSDLAANLGVTFQQIQKYERGANRVAASTLLRIATALDVDVGALLPGEVQSPPENVEQLAQSYALLSDAGRKLLLETAKTFVADRALRRPRPKR